VLLPLNCFGQTSQPNQCWCCDLITQKAQFPA